MEKELVSNRKRKRVVQHGYQAGGPLTSVTDANGQISRRFENTNGLMTAHTKAVGTVCR